MKRFILTDSAEISNKLNRTYTIYTIFQRHISGDSGCIWKDADSSAYYFFLYLPLNWHSLHSVIFY